MEQSLIEELFYIKARNDDNSKSLASLLNVLTSTVFGSTNRFVFELLQNADDSPKQPGEGVKVDFILTDNYLIFSHSGKHFSNDDVRGISNVASGDSGKAKDTEKTGYKGIGFKSVFGISPCVYIKSNNFVFRFDKDYKLWREKNDYPWQIIPIWSENEIPSEVNLYIDKEKVTTIISIDSKKRILEEITEVFKDPQITLFLRNVVTISFYDKSNRLFKVEKKEINGFNQIYYNEQIRSTWLIKDFIINVPAELKKKLNQLSDQECPEKLKLTNKTKLTFAAKIEDGKLVRVKESLIYSYLPTKLNMQFPFLINGDFILNAERSDLLENDWNFFLLFQIAHYKIIWLSELANSIYKNQITCLIKEKFPQPNTKVKKSYNEGLEYAISNIGFIPGRINGKLLKVNECLIDQINLSDYFDTKIIEKFYDDKYFIAASTINNTNKLIALGAQTFNFEKLTKLIEWFNFQEIIKIPENNLKLILFFINSTTEKKQEDWLKKLNDINFLLSKGCNLCSPSTIYYPLKNGREFDFIQLEFLHPYILEHIQSDKNKNEWLNSIGVKDSSEIEILRRSIYHMIEHKLINASNAIIVGQFVFKVYKSGKLSDLDYQKLKKLWLLTSKSKILLPEKCYLSNLYDPELKIENILNDGNFISENYVEKREDISGWKDLFLKIGVREKVKIFPERGKTYRRTLQSNYPQISTYLTDYIDSSNIYPSRTYGYRDSQHQINNFVYVEFMEFLSDYSFAKIFWKIIFQEYWIALHELSIDTSYHTMISDNKIDSYIQYRVCNFPSIPSFDRKVYKSVDIYTPKLRSLLSEYLPVVDLDITLTEEQIEFLKLKRILDVDDILNVFKIISNEDFSHKKVDIISLLYKHLLLQNKESEKEVIEKIKLWNSTGKLLATDDTYRNLNQLFCFMVAGVAQPANSEYFIKIPTTIQLNEQKEICNLFEIPIISYNNLELKTKIRKHDDNLFIQLKEKIDYICSLYSNFTYEDPKPVHQRFNEKLQRTNFYKVEMMELVYEVNNVIIYRQKTNTWYDNNFNFYYADEWNSPLTLYSLSNSLCSYFGLENIENELTLILQLDLNQLKKWFLERDYKFFTYSNSVLSEEKFYKEDHSNSREFENDEHTNTEDSNDSPNNQLTIFSPEVKASDINYSTLNVFNRNLNSTIINDDNKEYDTIQDDDVKVDIGKWGKLQLIII
ncbi:sacsin N-terminal ATP-binding-like domain-containing protein [Bacillus sp. T3]|uniref:sacsin N-terminal ATP-binding-like domain-containing protein n=1 Tax=Bacillus sp. T3 TaxID=467262 RepID=UPI0029823FCD|nr:hypothetical protein [Bacillus sp. T3]